LREVSDAALLWGISSGQGSGSLRAAVRPAGGTWSQPSLVAPDVDPSGAAIQASPYQVAILPGRVVLAVWEQTWNGRSEAQVTCALARTPFG
jgi:hypothetical protein